MLHKRYGLLLTTLAFITIMYALMAWQIVGDDNRTAVSSESLAYVVQTEDSPPVEQKATTPVKKKGPKNVILMIGDGMGITHITAATIANKNTLELERFPFVGLMKTFSTQLITDSAASATAMSTGKKTYNGAIAQDPKGRKLKTVVEIAEEQKLATGIVTTSSVTHATPAAFYAHQPKRSRINREVSAEFMTKGIEVLMGGGKRYFLKEHRKDNRNLIRELQRKGYKVVDSIDELGETVPKKVVCLIADMQPKGIKTRGDYLPKATKKATEILNQNKKGFFMMVEGAQIDWGGHSRNSKYIIREMLDFDRSVGEALDFAEADGETLVIVTSDHETGGYSINAGSLKDGEIKTKFTDDYHTAAMVPVYAYGPGAEKFSGTIDNTDIFFKVCELLNLPVPEDVLKEREDQLKLLAVDSIAVGQDSAAIMSDHGDFGGFGKRMLEKDKK